jgi:hypothetical protein
MPLPGRITAAPPEVHGFEKLTSLRRSDYLPVIRSPISGPFIGIAKFWEGADAEGQ